MEEITPTSGATPAVPPVTPPALAATTTTTPETPAVEGEQISLEEAKKLRKEAQALRTRLKGYEDAETAKQQAALSDVEKANKQVADLQQKYDQQQKQLVASHVKLVAAGKGIIDPDLAALAIADHLEYGDDGMPSNLDKALDELIKNKPYLAKAADPATTPAQTANARTTPALPAMNPGRSSIPAPSQSLSRKNWPKLGDILK
jgi:hypothetical protein